MPALMSANDPKRTSARKLNRSATTELVRLNETVIHKAAFRHASWGRSFLQPLFSLF